MREHEYIGWLIEYLDFMRLFMASGQGILGYCVDFMECFGVWGEF